VGELVGYWGGVGTQVNLSEMVNDRQGIRQHGFQECDIVSIMKPVTKSATLITTHEMLAPALLDALALSQSGRKGPCLVDIPLNFQCSRLVRPPPQKLEPAVPGLSDTDRASVAEALEHVARASRPLVLLGGGINSSGCADGVRALVRALGVPCIHSLLACDVLPCTDALRIGMLGTYGERAPNHFVMQADVLLVLGSRLDVRQTGSETERFAARTIYQVDISEGEVNFRVKGVRPVMADLRAFVDEAAAVVHARALRCGCDEWRTLVAQKRVEWPVESEPVHLASDKINPSAFIKALSRRSQRHGAHFTSGCGNIQMWAAQSCELLEGQRLLMPGGHSPMGAGLPLAIGACFASDRPCVVIEGDGGLQMNIQEMQTVRRNYLPIKVVVMNNGCLGMLRTFCQAYFDNRFHQTVWGWGGGGGGGGGGSG
jgi:acetolactate synthase-1/2/3 large subunit